MSKHPLTDEICEHLADTTDRPFTAVERGNMRAAADWQLEQVLEWLDKNLENYSDNDVLVINGDCEFTYQLREDLEKAMRPQEDN